jgi:hypothetical protein
MLVFTAAPNPNGSMYIQALMLRQMPIVERAMDASGSNPVTAHINSTGEALGISQQEREMKREALTEVAHCRMQSVVPLLPCTAYNREQCRMSGMAADFFVLVDHSSQRSVHVSAASF